MSKSLIQEKKECFFCGSPYVEKHHIYAGYANRKLSEENGCWCWLCVRHHTTSEGVHRNRKMDLVLKKLCQQEFEKRIGDRDVFRHTFGKSFL